jgi:hypothetical protein
MDYNLLIRLILAHLLSDFILQPTKWAEDKDTKGFSSRYLYLHVLITGITTMLIVCDKNYLLAIGIITVIHGLTDGIKAEVIKYNIKRLSANTFKKLPIFDQFLSKLSKLYLFTIDQIIHIIIIGVTWLIVTNQSSRLYSDFVIMLQCKIFWLYILSYTWVTIPVAVIIGKITEGWNNELKEAKTTNIDTIGSAKSDKHGLKNAGKWIGIIERILILTFVVNLQYSAIGFMLTAKSVFRFGDLKDNKDHKKTEYIIIGTFLSFMLSIMTGIILNYVTR